MRRGLMLAVGFVAKRAVIYMIGRFSIFIVITQIPILTKQPRLLRSSRLDGPLHLVHKAPGSLGRRRYRLAVSIGPRDKRSIERSGRHGSHPQLTEQSIRRTAGPSPAPSCTISLPIAFGDDSVFPRPPVAAWQAPVLGFVPAHKRFAVAIVN